MKFEKLIKERYSCRKFKDKAVEQEKIDKILEAGLVAPTACNLQERLLKKELRFLTRQVH
jgi:nitroreductase